MATIPFLPDRLNREPVVWRGLTTSELFLALAVGLGGGCAFGILFALITHYWPLIPGSALAGRKPFQSATQSGASRRKEAVPKASGSTTSRLPS